MSRETSQRLSLLPDSQCRVTATSDSQTANPQLNSCAPSQATFFGTPLTVAPLSASPCASAMGLSGLQRGSSLDRLCSLGRSGSSGSLRTALTGLSGALAVNSAANTLPVTRRPKSEVKKCRKVYGIENREMWCLQCRFLLFPLLFILNLCFCTLPRNELIYLFVFR